jgi:chloramphenicol-sensitive protein RarD
MADEKKEFSRGLLSISAVYLIWGILPAYWRLLSSIPSVAVMAHRAIWCLVAAFLAAAIQRRGRPLFPRLDRRSFLLLLLASASLAAQWAAYLAAVGSGRLVDLSLGYFLYPLVVTLLARILFKEKLSPAKMASLVLACIGVGAALVTRGTLPVLALVLALSFSLYSLIKRTIKIDALSSTFYEVLFLSPLALAYLLWSGKGFEGFFAGGGPGIALLLVGGGLATALTLLLFAAGARRIPVFVTGLLQYISPTMVLLLGVIAYGESFGPAQWLIFLPIWLGIIVYAAAEILTAIRARSSRI